MDFGIILGDVPVTVSEKDHFDSILRQVQAAQRAGLNHILMGQHFIFERSRWLQPVPVLARLAGELDSHVRLVTQILIAPLYHPVMLAEELATLDVVTDGRLSVGLGLGYIPAEYEMFGVPFNERGARLNETIEILKLMWTQDRVSYQGNTSTSTTSLCTSGPSSSRTLRSGSGPEARPASAAPHASVTPGRSRPR